MTKAEDSGGRADIQTNAQGTVSRGSVDERSIPGVCFRPQKYKQSIWSADKLRTEEGLALTTSFLLSDICLSR